MGIEQDKQMLELCFTEYEELQILHLNVIKTEPMPDIAAMTHDRDKVFDRLKQNINNFVGNAGSNGGAESLSMLREYEARLASIMNVNEDLSKAVEKYRENLKTKLAQMKRNKTALRGYKAVNLS